MHFNIMLVSTALTHTVFNLFKLSWYDAIPSRCTKLDWYDVFQGELVRHGTKNFSLGTIGTNPFGIYQLGTV